MTVLAQYIKPGSKVAPFKLLKSLKFISTIIKSVPNKRLITSDCGLVYIVIYDVINTDS